MISKVLSIRLGLSALLNKFRTSYWIKPRCLLRPDLQNLVESDFTDGDNVNIEFRYEPFCVALEQHRLTRHPRANKGDRWDCSML